MGTSCHAHMQMTGSQGDLHHFLKPYEDAKSVVRAIHSPRLFAPFRKSYRAYFDTNKIPSPEVVPYDAHDTSCVVSRLRGRGPQPVAVSLDEVLRRRRGGGGTKKRHRAAAKIGAGPTKRRKCGGSEAGEELKTLWVGEHRNGLLKDDEKTKRSYIVGMPAIEKRFLLWNKYTQERLYREGKTASFVSEADDTRVAPGDDVPLKDGVTAGPFVVGPDEFGPRRLVRPGKIMEEKEVDELLRIDVNKHGKMIMNPDYPVGMQLRLIAKNHSSLFKTLITCSRGEGRLEPMMIRSRGGAAGVAGANQMDSSSKRVHRSSPNLTLSTSQKVNDQVSLGFCELVKHRQVVNVFMNGMYCGAWVAKEVRYRYLDDEEVWAEYEAFENLIRGLHDRGGEEDRDLLELLGLGRTMDETMEHHLQSMASASMWLVLEPLDPDILKMWGGKPDTVVPWDVVQVYERDMVIPSMGFSSAEEARKAVGAQRNKPFNGWDSFLRVMPLSCISEAARIKSGMGRDEAGAMSGGHVGSLLEMNLNAGGNMKLSDVLNLFFQTQGMTIVKMCSPDVVTTACLGTIYPPRAFLDKLPPESKKNLKPLSTRPVHPATLNHDPVPHLCAVATGCFNENREERGKSDRPRIRWGSEWVGENWEEAWGVMFKCVVGCVTQSTVLLQLWDEDETHDDDVTKLMPGPNEKHLEGFLGRVAEYEWKSRLVHPIFRGTLRSSAIYFRFLRGVCSPAGVEAFRRAVNTGETRYSKLLRLKEDIGTICQLDLSEFQVQVLFRTIECCINEPFGPVDFVPTGPGGEMGAKCLLKCYRDSPFSKEEDPNVGTKTRPAKMKAGLKEIQKIPFWLVREFNQRVGGIMKSKNEKRIAQLKDELKVCFLEWDKKEGCLYHTLGIRRRFDACDTEHLLCLLSTCHQFTLPSRNVGLKNALDCEKHHPVRFDSEKRVARDLPFMEMMLEIYDEVERALIRLLEDESYEFWRLADIFRIDSDEA